MKKNILTRVSLMFIILVALFMMTSSVWAESKAGEPVEEPSASIPRKTGSRINGEKDGRVCYPTCIWKMLGCQCTRQQK